MHDTLQDISICRRLRLALFLDGSATPCSMLPCGELCDVCTRQLHDQPTKGIPTMFPAHLGKLSSGDVPVLTENAPITTASQSSRNVSGRTQDRNIDEIHTTARPTHLSDPTEPRRECFCCRGVGFTHVIDGQAQTCYNFPFSQTLSRIPRQVLVLAITLSLPKPQLRSPAVPLLTTLD
jgi:hypothetical protein